MTDSEPNPPPGAPKQPTPRNATEARQGIRSGRVVWVLIGGIVLVVIAYLVIGAFTDVQHPPPSIGVVDGPAGAAPPASQPGK